MILSPHDGSDYADCPFQPGQHVRVVVQSIIGYLHHVGEVMDAGGLHPHRCGGRWFVWVRLAIGNVPAIFLTDYLAALPC